MQGRDQDFETFYNNRYAPLEHIFDNHAYCSPVWCWAKQIPKTAATTLQSSEPQTVTQSIYQNQHCEAICSNEDVWS